MHFGFRHPLNIKMAVATMNGVDYWVNVTRNFNSILEALKSNPYQMLEICFVKPWFFQLNKESYDLYKHFLKFGQIEILNSG